MITLTSKQKDFSINLPTELSEIDAKVLTRMTSHIRLSKHYSIVAICKHVDLAQFILANTNSKHSNALVTVVPLLAKGDSDAPVGSKIFINPTEIERGEHIYINTVISENFLYNYIDSDDILRKGILTTMNKTKVYIVSFKLVPNSAIHGYCVGEYKYTDDEFYTKTSQSGTIPFTGLD